MKYLQEENTPDLIIYSVVFILISILVIAWDVYDKKKSEQKGEYRDLLSIFRLRGVALMSLFSFFICVLELLKRFRG